MLLRGKLQGCLNIDSVSTFLLLTLARIIRYQQQYHPRLGQRPLCMMRHLPLLTAGIIIAIARVLRNYASV